MLGAALLQRWVFSTQRGTPVHPDLPFHAKSNAKEGDVVAC